MTVQDSVAVFEPDNAKKHKVLFLGYDRQSTNLIDALLEAQCEVHHTAGAIPQGGFDLIVSFGYRHVIKGETIDRMSCPIINLHISYLPYNRGAHPNFWSFFDGTPAGVTIHLIDEGIDTGPVLFQRMVSFDRDEVTFVQTQNRLLEEIEDLFCDHLQDILAKNWTEKPQTGSGTLHFKRDLPKAFKGWNSDIEDEIKRLHEILGTSDA